MVSADYTGQVAPGGGAAVRELGGLTITKVAVDEQMSNNCYLLRCHDDRRAGADRRGRRARRRCSPLVGDAGLTTVVTTHQHWDHHRALADVVAATGATTVAGRPDAEAITEQTGVAVARPVGDGDTVAVGSCTLRVIGLVGHTPGSIALVYDDPAAGGGTPTSSPATRSSPAASATPSATPTTFRSLLDDVEAKLFGTLPDETWFYPGHGDDSTLGAERPHLAEWRTRGW